MLSEPLLDTWQGEAEVLLRTLIGIPSFSGDEDRAATALYDFLAAHGARPSRAGNNVWAASELWDDAAPTLLLNGHLDTVRPNGAYTRDPFDAAVEHGRLYGLGSNDAGGALVALAAAFLCLRVSETIQWNLLFSATGEEENSGPGGIEALLPHLPRIDAAIVGEPTCMQMAVAERGLLVLDCTARGRAGHAARNEGENALYIALDDVARLRALVFDRHSPLLGDVSLNVTMIAAGTQHNIIPASCSFVVDLRSTECYTHEELLTILRGVLRSEVLPRSLRLRATALPAGHVLLRAGSALGLESYGSPTTSNKALVPFPALKLGPGESARSHTADEYIERAEIREGIRLYIQLLQQLRRDTP